MCSVASDFIVQRALHSYLWKHVGWYLSVSSVEICDRFKTQTLGLYDIHTNKLHQYFNRVIHADAHNNSAVYNEFTNLTVGDKGCLKRQFYHKEMYVLNVSPK